MRPFRASEDGFFGPRIIFGPIQSIRIGFVEPRNCFMQFDLLSAAYIRIIYETNHGPFHPWLIHCDTAPDVFSSTTNRRTNAAVSGV